MAKICVERSLDNVRQALAQAGYEVVELTKENLKNCDCCIITGQDQNMMGMADTVTKARVINARGMSADEVVKEVSATVGKAHQYQ